MPEMREREADDADFRVCRTWQRREILQRFFVIAFWLGVFGRRMLRRGLRLPLTLTLIRITNLYPPISLLC